MNHSEKRHKTITRNVSKRMHQEQLMLQMGHSLDTLPLEVLEMIFKFLPYRDVAGPVRLTNKKCSSVATTTLNSAFLSADKRIKSAMQHLQNATERATDECMLMIHGKAHNYLEFVKTQYELLRASVWRYTHPPRKEKFFRLCFYGGLILDNLDTILRTAFKSPVQLLDKDGPAACILSFGELCRKFANDFERNCERKVNNKSTLVSGCKLVDLLDCLLDGREVLHFKVSPTTGKRHSTVTMKLRYVMKHAWFTYLDVPGTKNENSWRDQQRFMYLRIRRLVGSVNVHLLQKLHYERELLMRVSDLLPIPKPPTGSTYSGYGEYAGKFFYYGNMNEYAFDSKIMDAWRKKSARDRMRKRVPEKRPCYDLVINVDLKCSPELAPLSIRSLLKCDHFENSYVTNNSRPELYLKMGVHCPASISNNLPGNLTWELRSPRHRKS